MRAFFGGQIKKEHRGNLALVVETPEDPNGLYTPFLCQVDSKEFSQRTGAGYANKMPKRVYIGVSQRAGDQARRTISSTHVSRDLDSVDYMLILPCFRDKNREKPGRVVLEETETGYVVVEGR